MSPPVHVIPKDGRRGLSERFLGPLPASTDQFFNEPFRFPPRGYVVERIQSGDRRMRDAMIKTLREAATRERPFDLQLTFGALLRECAEQPRVEKWVRGWRDRETEDRVRGVLSYALGEAGPRPMTPAPGLRPDLDELERRALEPALDDAAAVGARDAVFELAAYDRPRAVGAARTALDASAPHAYVLPLLRALDQFPEPGALARWLEGHGLAPQRPHDDGCWAEAVLARRGRVVSYDREELYEDLLYRCASAAREHLAGVHFEELPPESHERYRRALATLVIEPDPSEPEPVILLAHDRDRVLATVAEPGGHDLDAVRGLLNRCLRERISPLRIARLITDRPCVLAGDEAGLHAAAERELLLLAL